jgi:hypothetical protein
MLMVFLSSIEDYHDDDDVVQKEDLADAWQRYRGSTEGREE